MTTEHTVTTTRAAEDRLLSDYSLAFKYQTEEALEANVRSLDRPIEVYRLPLDLTLLRRYIKGHRVLDFPIGAGRLYPHLINEYELYGFDVNENYIKRAKAAYPDLAQRFELHSFESVETPLRFETVYTMRVFNNVKDHRLAVSNMARLLLPGGRWLFNMQQRNVDNPDFRQALDEAGFKILTLHKYDAYVAFGSMPPMMNYLYGSLFLRAVRLGLMTRWLYRLVDRLLARHGSYFVVAERQ